MRIHIQKMLPNLCFPVSCPQFVPQPSRPSHPLSHPFGSLISCATT